LLHISHANIADHVGAVYFSNHFTLIEGVSTEIMMATISNSTFTKIRPGSKAILLVIAASILNLENTVLDDVYAFSRGAGAYVEGATFIGKNVTFIRN